MARLIGVDLPRDKRVEVALTYIFGVGRTRAEQTLEATGVDPSTRVRHQSTSGYPKPADLCLGRVKRRETGVEPEAVMMCKSLV
jgi:hypothetical protein